MYQKRNNEYEIIALFLKDYKAEFYLRQLSVLTKLPLKTCQDALKNLEKRNILKSKIDGKNKYFSFNLENIKTKSSLLHTEIYRTDLFLDKYPLIKTFMKAIETNTPIIVFGSFAGFNANKNSDLDLLIISEKEEMPFHLMPYKVHDITLSEKSFIKAISAKETLIKEIEEKHIILNNHSFYVTAMWSHYGKQ